MENNKTLKKKLIYIYSVFSTPKSQKFVPAQNFLALLISNLCFLIHNYKFYSKLCHLTCRQSILLLYNLRWNGHLATTCLSTMMSFVDVTGLVFKRLLTRKVVYFASDQ